MLVHLPGVMDHWDPRVVDGLAAKDHVIAFDDRGVGSSSGKPANTMEQMAATANASVILRIRASRNDVKRVRATRLRGYTSRHLSEAFPMAVAF